ncbi:type II toxin-antitoxin system RelE/ParE family toxin [Patescibacteria group bacterium]|nr:type II toxin-antitoxin system RelE/ParE family toxin [Patescibacteria group bacterium]
MIFKLSFYRLRIVSNFSIRIFYTFQDDTIWVLHAFIKKSQKIPQKELEVAINRLKYLR